MFAPLLEGLENPVLEKMLELAPCPKPSKEYKGGNNEGESGPPSLPNPTEGMSGSMKEDNQGEESDLLSLRGRKRTAVTPRDRCARCLPVIRCCCLVICLCVASCHVIMCIASSCFQNLHPSGFPQFRPLSVLSPDTLARARGTSKILFYKWPENVLGMG